MNLTTSARYIALFQDASAGAAKPGYVDSVDMRIKSVSMSVEKYLRRFTEVAERVAKFSPTCGIGTKQIRLPGFPVTEIDSISLAGQVMDSSLYVVDLDSGIVSFSEPITRDVDAPYENTIVVTYTGGMADDTDDFINKFADIENAVLTQVRFEIVRSKDIAMKSVSNGQSSSQLVEYGLLKAVADTLDFYKLVPWA